MPSLKSQSLSGGQELAFYTRIATLTLSFFDFTILGEGGGILSEGKLRGELYHILYYV